MVLCVVLSLLGASRKSKRIFVFVFFLWSNLSLSDKFFIVFFCFFEENEPNPTPSICVKRTQL